MESLSNICHELHRGEYWTEQAYYNILEDIVERAIDSEHCEDYENIVYAIDDALIYYDDQWVVVRHHCIDPRDFNYEQIMDDLFADAVELYDRYREVQNESKKTLR